MEVDRRFRGLLERLLGTRRSETAAEVSTDSELLRRFANGDQSAFELLIWRHGSMVLGTCQRLIRDEHLAEDAFQAVFLVLARQGRTIRSRNVVGWLYRVARRIAAKAMHNRGRMSELHVIASQQQTCPIEREELSLILDTEIARLPERLRKPLLLCYLEGHSTQAAAREIGCPRGTILSRLSTARKLLAERLGRRGVKLPAALLVGYEMNVRLVSATVLAAVRFQSSCSQANTASLLAGEVIRTMKQSKLMTSIASAIIAVGMLTGIGLVAAQTDTGSRVPNVSMTDDEPDRGSHKSNSATVQLKKTDDAKLETDAIKKEEALEELVNKIERQLKLVFEDTLKLKADMAEKAIRTRIDIQLNQKIYDLERESQLDEVRSAAEKYRKARNSLNDLPTIYEKEKYDQTPAVVNAKRNLENSLKDLNKVKDDLKKLDERFITLLEKLRSEGETEFQRMELFERSIASGREQLLEEQLMVKRQLFALQMQKLGITQAPSSDGLERKLDRLSREIGELRKQLQELKKPK